MALKDYKQVKTTVIGLVLIGTGIYCLVQGVTTDATVIGGFIVAGIMLVFASDRFINVVLDAIKNKFK
jgi:hypothetical protein